MWLLCVAQIKPLLRRVVDFQSAVAIVLLKVAFSREQNSLCCSLGFVFGVRTSGAEAFSGVLQKKKMPWGPPRCSQQRSGLNRPACTLQRDFSHLVGQADQDAGRPAPADPIRSQTVRISLFSVVFATSTPGFFVFPHFSALINCRLARGGTSHR